MTNQLEALIAEMKAAAEKASKGDWVKESGDGWEAACSNDDQANGGFIIAHFEGADAAENREFVQAANPANVLALIAALEQSQGMETYWKTQCRGITDHCEKLQAQITASSKQEEDSRNTALRQSEIIDLQDKRISELEAEIKFPGVMRCNACNFSRSHVIVTPGGMTAGESAPEHCPNGCGPLWHDTYRRQYNELYDAYKQIEPIRSAAEKLVRCKGRYHSEQNYRALAALFGVTMPDLPPLEGEASQSQSIPALYLCRVFRNGEELYSPCGKDYPRGLAYYTKPTQLAVKLPNRLQPGADGPDDWYLHSDPDGEYMKADDVVEAIRAAGITVQGDE